jgi:hypothetical protein
MKTIMFILIAVALVVTGCGKREVRKSATLNLDFEVEANTDSALVFQTAGMLSTITNASIAEVKEEISRYEIKSIKYSIWELYGNDSCVFNGTLRIGKIGDASSAVYYSYNNFGFEPVQEKIDIPFSDNERVRLEDFLLSADGLEFVLGGSLSHKPIHFVMNIELNVDVLAEK